MAEKIREGKVRCSFCQKTEDQVRKLIAGPDGAPGPFHILGFQRNTIIFLWNKFADFFFALCDHGKGGGLHPATGKLGIVFTGEGSGTVHSHQPVCFCPCNSCTIKIVIVMPVFQIGKAFFNCFICDWGNPQSLNWLMAACFFQDPAGCNISKKWIPAPLISLIF